MIGDLISAIWIVSCRWWSWFCLYDFCDGSIYFHLVFTISIVC